MDITQTKQSDGKDLMQLVCKLGNEEFGIDILQVQEIIRMVEVTHIPDTPDFIDGVINFRGKVIPVMSLRRRFGMEDKDRDQFTRIIVVELPGMIVGFTVDEVSEVLRIPADAVEPPPAIVTGIEAGYVTSVAKLDERMLILLDLEKVTVGDHSVEQIL